MAILESTTEVAQDVKHITSKEYALAAFIMGCLIHEEVVQINNFEATELSDMEAGIRIIASCLKNYDEQEKRYSLPFRW